MLTELDSTQWEQERAGLKDTLLFNDPVFLDRLASAYGLQLRFFGYKDQKYTSYILAAFIRGKKIVLPTHFFYSAFIINTGLRDFTLNDHLQKGLLQLKKEFSGIELKLTPAVQDIRSFKQSGFQQQVYYTYYKDLGDLHYSDNVNRILKKDRSAYSFHINGETSKSIAANVEQILLFGAGKKEKQPVQDWLGFLLSSGQALSFEVFHEEKGFQGSAIMGIDPEQAYLLMIHTTAAAAADGAQVALYDYVFHTLKGRGLKRVDLLGGNIPSIAQFKSKLNAEAVPYFTVNYQRFRLFQQFRSLLKKKLKSLIRK